MKYLIVLAVCIYSASAKIKCVQGTNGTAAATDCADAKETLCSSPKFTEFTGEAANVKYACGKCTVEEGCQQCTGSADKGCNALVAGADFMCYTYTYNTTSKSFVAAAKATACKRKKDTAIVCNMPKAGASTTNYTLKTGCGNCTKADTACESCGKDSCNKASDAIRVVVMLAPLLAVLFNLMY